MTVVALWGQELHPLRHSWVMMRMWGGFGNTLGLGDSFEGTLVAKRGHGVALVALGVRRRIPYSRVCDRGNVRWL